MAVSEFQGIALAMSGDGLSSAGEMLGVHGAEIWTVLAVET